MNARRTWYSLAILLLAPALASLAAEKDQYGDTLPEGAKARIGTARLRTTTYTAPTLTPDGKSLYAQTNAGLTRLDPATGAVQGKAPAQFFGVPSAFSADGKRAVYASFDRVTIWDTESGKSVAKVERRIPSSDSPAALSADGKTLAIGGASDRGKGEAVTVLVWNVDTDKEVKKFTVPQNDYASVAISGDGKTVAAWGAFTDPNAKDQPDPETNITRFVYFYDAATGKELSKFRTSGYMASTVAFSPDGSVAAVANNNSSVDLVDPKTGASKHLLLGRGRTGRWLTFSPDGGTVAATTDDGSVLRWKVVDGSRLSITEAPVSAMYNPRVRLVDNEKGVAWGGKGSAAVVWEVPSGKPISPVGGHTSTVRSVTVTPDIKHLITSAEDGTTLKWELATGKPLGDVKFRGPNYGYDVKLPTAHFSAKMTHALIRDNGGNGVGVFDVASLSEQYVIPTAPDGYSYGNFSADGSKVIITTTSYNTKKVPARLAVWDVATTKRLLSLELPGVGTLNGTITPDGKHILTAARKPADKGNGEFLITAWDAATGAKKGEYTEEAGYSNLGITAASDSKTAVAVTSKGSVVVFEIGTGKVGQTLDINRRMPGLPPVFSLDGKKLAIGCQSDFGTGQAAIVVLDWETKKVKYTFNVPGGTPSCLAFSPDGNWLVSGSPDTTATVWDVSQ